MKNPYGSLFEAPGSMRFSAAGFVARMPLSMNTLGIVTMLSQLRGDYWIAGAVSAAFALCNALIAPQISRLVDRFGQARVIVPASAVSIIGLTGLMIAARLDAPVWVLFVFAVVAGFMPSIAAMVRSRWAHIYRDSPKLHTAFALESVVDETIFIVGPIVSIGLSVGLFPEAGSLAAAILLGIGTILFAAQKGTEPPVVPVDGTARTSVIRIPAVQLLTLTLIGIGTIFGTAEVTAVAFAEMQGNKGAASVLLAGYAAGSLLIGLLYGAFSFRMPLERQLVIAIAVAALTTIPPLFASTIPMLAIALFIAGSAVSPTIILSMGLVQRAVPAAMLTEGITWAVTGIGIGMALGSMASGWVIEAYGASSGFGVSTVAGIVAFITVVLAYRSLAAPKAHLA